MPDTKVRLLEAAKACILDTGYAGVTTRMVADTAGVPLSQIHYHFGSKHALMLALLEYINDQRLELYNDLFSSDLSLHAMWLRMGELLIEDLETGYTRVMQELVSAAYSEETLRSRVVDQFERWHATLYRFAALVEERIGPVGPLNGNELAALLDAVAVGINQRMLLGISQRTIPGIYALDRFTTVLRELEEERA